MITEKTLYEIMILTDLDGTNPKFNKALAEFMLPTYDIPNEEHIVVDDFVDGEFYASTYSHYTAKMVELGVTKIINDFHGKVIK